MNFRVLGWYRAVLLVPSRTFDSGNTDITVDCLVETWFQFQLSEDQVSPFVSPSAWPPPSDGWTGTCWSCRAESQHLDRNTTDRKWKHCTRPWRQRLLKTFSQLKRRDWWGLWRLTLVELRRLRHLDSVHWTLSAAERNQSHFAVLVLKHAVFALQVQTVQDCRRGRRHGTHMETVSVTENKLLHDDNKRLQIFSMRRSSKRVITDIKTAHEHDADNWGLCDAAINRSDQDRKV